MPTAQTAHAATSANASGRGSGACHASSAKPTKNTIAGHRVAAGIREVALVDQPATRRAGRGGSPASPARWRLARRLASPNRISTGARLVRSDSATPPATTLRPSSTGQRPRPVKNSASGTPPPRSAPASTSSRVGVRVRDERAQREHRQHAQQRGDQQPRLQRVSRAQRRPPARTPAARRARRGTCAGVFSSSEPSIGDRLALAGADGELGRGDDVRVGQVRLPPRAEREVGAHRAQRRAVVGGEQAQLAVDDRGLGRQRRVAVVAAVGDDDVLGASRRAARPSR